MSVLSFLLAHWREALIGVGILAAVGYVHERDNRIRTEAVAEERLADFREADAAREELARTVARQDSALDAEAARLTRLEAEADSLRRLAERSVREASQRAVEAGEDLRATLDSIGRVEGAEELARTARQQLADHLRADHETMAAVEEERDAAASVAESLRSQVELWQDRFGSERELRLSTEDALNEARGALQVETGGDFFTRLAWGAVGAAVGFGVAQIF